MGLRLPERFQNRWIYASVAFVGSLLVLPIWFLILSRNVGSSSEILSGVIFMEVLQIGAVMAGSAAISAKICWPNGVRTQMRMGIAGCLTVLLSFVVIGIIVSVVDAGLGNPLNWVFMGFLYVLWGSILTFGLPYIIAVILSRLFVE